MQRNDDSSSSSSMMYSATMNNMNPNFTDHQQQQQQQQPHLKCPRCDSNNTKFCYYNNYNLSQPRHFCKSCRRYWTKGGTLRNIPIGGGTRKNATKRSLNYSNKRTGGVHVHNNNNSSSSYSANSAVVAPPPYGGGGQMEEGGGGGGNFSSLLLGSSTPGGQFAKLLMDGLSPNPNPVDGSCGGDGLIRNPNSTEEFESSFLRRNHHKTSDQIEGGGGGGSSYYNQRENGWPDLSIYTPPGSNFN